MAKKALSAPEIPLCINVLRLLNYRLAPDELILFDWLTVKQISFKYKPFHYSCLLYTSPSPRDLSTSRMPSSA